MTKRSKRASFDGSTKNLKLKKTTKNLKLNKVYDENGNVIASINKSQIFDKKGNTVAVFEKHIKEKSTKASLYSSNLGDFVCIKNQVFFNGETFGWISKKTKYFPLFTVFLAISFMLSVFIVSVNHINIPEDFKPTIVVADIGGSWNPQKTVAVFDEKIHPGSSGEYCFTIKNSNEFEIEYAFSLDHFFNGLIIEEFPLLYKLKLKDRYLSDEWLSAKELSFDNIVIHSGQSQIFTLEYYWPFNSSNDEFDTSIGIAGGVYSIKLNISAQV